jgi:hypothetical protein
VTAWANAREDETRSNDKTSANVRRIRFLQE